jgi:hypothetical protein
MTYMHLVVSGHVMITGMEILEANCILLLLGRQRFSGLVINA